MWLVSGTRRCPVPHSLLFTVGKFHFTLNQYTSAWLPGEVIPDAHGLVPPDTVVVHIGMYDQTSGERVPVYSILGIRQPEDVIYLASCTEK